MQPIASEQKALINGQTGRIGWQELQRHFARGVVQCVGSEVDLIEVALHFIQDDKTAVAQLMDSGQLAPASEEDARNWHQSDAELWAVVIAPWVLVQAVKT